MREALKWIGAPGSIGFLLAGVAVALAFRYVWPRHRVLSRACLLLLGAIYLVLSLPPVAHALGDSLGPRRPVEVIYRPDVIILLDGDNIEGRARAAADAHDWWPDAPVLVLGPEWLASKLVAMRIPRHLVRTDAEPATTRAQLEWMKQYLASRPGTSAALIASRLQMPRVAGLAASMGIRAQLIASPLDAAPARWGVQKAVPSYSALRLASDALYEHAALFFYRHRDWIADRRGSARKTRRAPAASPQSARSSARRHPPAARPGSSRASYVPIPAPHTAADTSLDRLVCALWIP